MNGHSSYACVIVGLLALATISCSPPPSPPASAVAGGSSSPPRRQAADTASPALGNADSALHGSQLIAGILAIPPRITKPADLTLDVVQNALRMDLSDLHQINGHRGKVAEGWEYVVNGTFEGETRRVRFAFLHPGGWPGTDRCTVAYTPVRRSLEAMGHVSHRRAPVHGEERVQFKGRAATLVIDSYRTHGRRPIDLDCIDSVEIHTSEALATRIDASLLEARFLELAGEPMSYKDFDLRLVERVMQTQLERRAGDTPFKRRGQTIQGWDYWLTFISYGRKYNASFAIWLSREADEARDGADLCTLPLDEFEQSMRAIGYQGERQHGIHGGDMPLVRFRDPQRDGISVTARDYKPDPERAKDFSCIEHLQIGASTPL